MGIGVCVVFALVACSGPGEGSGGSAGDTLRVAVASDVLPNPALGTVYGDRAAITYSLAYAPLVHVGTDGSLQPALATSWRYIDESESTRNRLFELTLRDDARFSDGAAVDADAVAGWLAYFVETAGPFSGVLGPDPQFEAVDEHTVRIRMTAPNPAVASILSDQGPNIGFIVAPAAVENPDLLSSGTYGAGRYRLDNESSVRGDRYAYVSNEQFYDIDAPDYQKVDLRVIADPASRIQAQLSGQLDVSSGDVATVEAARDAGLNVISAAQGVVFLTLDTVNNTTVPAFADVRVRQAVNLAIDRAKIARAMLGEVGVPASSFLQTDIDAGLDDHWAYNPERARQLLAEAGYADGLSFPVLVQGAYRGNRGEPLLRAVAKYLSEVGIDVDITSYPTDPDYARDVFAYKAPMVALLDILSDTPTMYSSYLAPGAALNFFGGDPELDRLYADGAAAEDPTPAWTQMWQRFTEQAFVVPLVEDPNILYVTGDVGGIEMNRDHKTALPTEWSPAGG
ncbi:ABC transporter substrate-binding protein [Mycobacterium sp. NPDC003449]